MAFRNSGRSERRGQGASGEVLLALDMGTSALRLMGGQVDDEGQITVLGFAEGPSEGISKGAITDIDKLSSALARLITDFTGRFNCSCDALIVGVPGCFIASENKQGSAIVQSGKVTAADRDSAVDSARAAANFGDESRREYRLIHTLPQNFITPTSEEVLNPVGQFAKRIDVNAHIISCQIAHCMNLQSVISNVSADLEISRIVYAGLAAADSVLTEADREMGVCLIDIGAGGVSVSVYSARRLVCTFGYPGGGEMITRNIGIQFGLVPPVAEALKIRFGQAGGPGVTQNDPIRVPGSGNGDNMLIPRGMLCSEVQRSLSEILQITGGRISRFAETNHLTLNLGAGFVLTGGVAQTRYIGAAVNQAIVQIYTGRNESAYTKVRIGVPRGLQAGVEGIDVQALQNPQYAVVTGLLRAGHRELMQHVDAGERPQEGTSWRRKIAEWIKREF